MIPSQENSFDCVSVKICAFPLEQQPAPQPHSSYFFCWHCVPSFFVNFFPCLNDIALFFWHFLHLFSPFLCLQLDFHPLHILAAASLHFWFGELTVSDYMLDRRAVHRYFFSILHASSKVSSAHLILEDEALLLECL